MLCVPKPSRALHVSGRMDGLGSMVMAEKSDSRMRDMEMWAGERWIEFPLTATNFALHGLHLPVW